MARESLSTQQVLTRLRHAMPTLTVAQVRAQIDRWERRGYPLVTRVPCRRRGGFRRVVDAAELDAVLRGDLSQEPCT